MAKPVTVFESSDGHRFETAAEADNHDEVLGLANLLTDPSTDLWFKGSDAFEIAAWILKRYKLTPRNN